MTRKPKPKVRRWQPVTLDEVNPVYLEKSYPNGIAADGIKRVEAFGNDLYQGVVEHREDGWAHLSFKRHDRLPAHDWRHFQSIKNETVGPEREAFEIYPAESRVMDTANQYHLYVMPEGEVMPFGQFHRHVLTPAELRDTMGEGTLARQRPFQPGLSTGPEASCHG